MGFYYHELVWFFCSYFFQSLEWPSLANIVEHLISKVKICMHHFAPDKR